MTGRLALHARKRFRERFGAELSHLDYWHLVYNIRRNWELAKKLWERDFETFYLEVDVRGHKTGAIWHSRWGMIGTFFELHKRNRKYFFNQNLGQVTTAQSTITLRELVSKAQYVI